MRATAPTHRNPTTMQCPVCKTVNLVMTERSGIEIDYCPQCRGVWLDRGELDKIIDRSAPQAAAPAAQASPQAYPQQAPTYPQQAPTYPQQPPPGYHGGYPYKRKKREGFLGELFDFD